MKGDEFTEPPEEVPETKLASSGGPPQPPPRPPKVTGRDLLDPGEPGGERIFLPDYIEVKELAGMLGMKPFKVVADLLELRVFKFADELIDFSTAAAITQKHGFVAEKIL
jgi:translation initiation factor IF-2